MFKMAFQMSTDKKPFRPNNLCCSKLVIMYFVILPKAKSMFKSEILHTNLCQFYLKTLHNYLTCLNLHLNV